MEKIIGRENELSRLAEFASSDRPEFVAVYGRRRVGKTFLVRSAFRDKFVFYATGIIEGTYEDELEAFNTGLERYGWKGEKARNWMEAFKMLAELLKRNWLKPFGRMTTGVLAICWRTWSIVISSGDIITARTRMVASIS